MPHHYGDGGSDRMHSMATKCFKPYNFSSPTALPTMKNCTMMPQKNSYYDDSMMMKSLEMEPMLAEDQIISSMPNDRPFWAKRQENEISMSANNDEDLSIEYFQCAAPSKTATTTGSKREKTFQPVKESMRRFSDSDDIRKALENHHTYFFAHDGEEVNGDNKDEHCKEEEEETDIINNRNSYKSRTKIISIPNGVRIITEIVKNGDGGECGNEVFRNFRHLPTTANDKRLSKKSNSTLDDESNNDIGCNGNSNKNENDVDEAEDCH